MKQEKKSHPRRHTKDDEGPLSETVLLQRRALPLRIINIDAQDIQDQDTQDLVFRVWCPEIPGIRNPDRIIARAGFWCRSSRPVNPVHPVHRCSIYSPSRWICRVECVGGLTSNHEEHEWTLGPAGSLGSAPVRLDSLGLRAESSAPGFRGPVPIFRLAAWLALAALTLSSAQARQAPPETRTSSYTIQVKLLPEERLLEGNQVVEWRNATGKPAGELRFHLYWNAWLNNRSTWLREDSLRSRRRSSLRNPRPGRLELHPGGIAEGGGGRTLPGIGPHRRHGTSHSPDDGNKDDRTVLVVPLERPVQPGETIRVSIGWKAKIPRTFARTGFRGNFLLHGPLVSQAGSFSGRRHLELSPVPRRHRVSFPITGTTTSA